MRTTRLLVPLAVAPLISLLAQTSAHAVELEYSDPGLVATGVGSTTELGLVTGGVTRTTSWTATVALSTEDNGLYPTYGNESQSGTCSSTDPGDPNTRTAPTGSATGYTATVEQAWYVNRYIKLNASQNTSGQTRYHVLGCVFGNAKTVNGKRMTRALVGYNAYSTSSPSSARFIGNPTWDTYDSDDKANATLSIGATVRNFNINVTMPINRNVGHLEGNYGISGPDPLTVDSYSMVNTTHAWWQNDCPGGWSCGVKSTRGAVLEAVHGFVNGQSYSWSLQGSVRYRG